MPNQKAMRKRCLGGSSFMWVPKLDFGPKNGQIWPKICICGHFGPNIGLYGEFGAMPNQKTTRTMCLVGFPLCGYQNFCFLGFLAQKRPFSPQNMLFLLAHLVPGCGARAVSRKTPICFMYFLQISKCRELPDFWRNFLP